ncbi:MAG: MFS transporter [Bacillota bacterium]
MIIQIISKIKQQDYIKVLAILTIPYIALSLSLNGFLALLPFVRDEFALSRTEVGYYSTFFFMSSAVLAVFTGSVVDRIGPKLGLIFGVTLLGSMNIIFGFSPTYTVLLFLAPIAGIGQSIINPSVNKGIIIETPPAKHAVSMGITQSGVGIGGLVGASLLPFFGETFGWRITVQFSGLFVLLIALLVYKYYREGARSEGSEKDQAEPKTKHSSLIDNLRYFLLNKQFVFVCFIGAILAGSSIGAIFSHYAVYLSEDLSMSRAAAGLGLGIFQVGGIIGRPVWGWISERFFKGNRSQAISFLGLSAGVIYLLPALLFDEIRLSLVIVYIFSFLLGLTVFGWGGLYFATLAEYAGTERAGSAIGLGLLFNRLGILVAPPIFGLIADGQGNYNYSWLIFGAVIVLTSLLLMREQVTKGASLV